MNSIPAFLRRRLQYFFITLCLIFSGHALQAQNLTLDELMMLQRNTYACVNEYLIEKNWTVSYAYPPDSSSMGQCVWEYGKTEHSEATGWISLYFEKSAFNIIKYEIKDKNISDNILNKINDYKMKVIHSKSDAHHVKTDYEGKQYVVRVKNITDHYTDSINYMFELTTKDMYWIIRMDQ